mgnify:CR=1 FL=1
MIRHGRLKGKPYRPTQREAIEVIRNSRKRFIACNAPTGSGKSVIAMESMPRPLFYLCSSKHLQDQIQRDYPDIVVLKGRENYSCPIFDNAGMCYLSDCGEYCEYEETKAKAMASEVAVLNFHYFLTYMNFAKRKDELLKHIVVDEADAIEDVIVNFISFTVNVDELKQKGIYSTPKKKTVISSVVEFLRSAKEEVKWKINEIKPRVTDAMKVIRSGAKITKEQGMILKAFKWYQEFSWKCDLLLSQDLSTWIYYFNGRTIYLKPKWLTRELMDTYFFRHGLKFLFMSATLPAYPIFCGLFGLSLDEVEYLEFSSDFPVENRPVIFEPKWKLSRSNKVEVERIRKEVLKLIEHEKGKGIIHTVSYSLTEILKNLHPRLIFHNSHNRDKMFKKFLKSQDGIWVSPSSIRGIDLPYDLCRWILFIKCPFADLSDPVTSARAYSGKFGNLWYKAKCIQDIIQGAGRGMRNKDDWCRTYVWDKLALDLLTRNPSLFPMWFREAVEIK